MGRENEDVADPYDKGVSITANYRAAFDAAGDGNFIVELSGGPNDGGYAVIPADLLFKAFVFTAPHLMCDYEDAMYVYDGSLSRDRATYLPPADPEAVSA